MIIDVGVEIIEWQKVSHNAAIMFSHKFTVWKDDIQKLLQPDAWSEFNTCCRFRSHHYDNGRGEFKWTRNFRISCQVTVLDMEIPTSNNG